jgi:hypothetical protein
VCVIFCSLSSVSRKRLRCESHPLCFVHGWNNTALVSLFVEHVCILKRWIVLEERLDLCSVTHPCILWLTFAYWTEYMRGLLVFIFWWRWISARRSSVLPSTFIFCILCWTRSNSSRTTISNSNLPVNFSLRWTSVKRNSWQSQWWYLKCMYCLQPAQAVLTKGRKEKVKAIHFVGTICMRKYK